MRHPRWREGRLSTAFIAEEYPDGFLRPPLEEDQRHRAAAIAVAVEIARQRRLDRHGDRLRPAGPGATAWEVKIDGDYVAVRLDGPLDATILALNVDGTPMHLAGTYRPGERQIELTVDGTPVFAQLRDSPKGLAIFLDGFWTLARVFSPAVAALDRLMPIKLPPDTSKLLLCPMPGLVVSILVTEGQPVKAGETLAVVEAMKMENVLRADRDLVVGAVLAAAGDSLAVDAVIMEFA